MAFHTLHTHRLTLRRLEKSDASDVLFLRGDREMNRYIKRKRPESIADALAFIDRIDSDIEENKIHYWCLSRTGEQGMIGSICLWNFSEDRIKAEVGYDLHPSHRGAGLMQEALSRVLDLGFGELDLKSIEAYTHRKNSSSTRLLERNGFILEEERTDEENEDNAIYVCRAPI